MRRATVLSILLVLGLGTSCASVTIKKVPSPGQYAKWTAEDQKAADAITGVRYYMPRPYINVYEPFPVAAEAFLVTGKLAADGHHVLIQKPTGTGFPELIAGGAVDKNADVFSVPKSLILTRVTKPDDTGSNWVPLGSTTPPPTATKGSGTGTSQVEAKTGVTTKKVTNDNSANAVTILRRYFDVAYMPDFDEMYAVDASGWLGNADMELNLGQGWSLQGLSGKSDNSELNKRIFDIMDTAISAAKTAGFNAMGIPIPPDAAKNLVSSVFTPIKNNLDAADAATVKAGDLLFTLKIHVVKFASPGLYPLIKPREVLDSRPNFVAVPTDAGLAIKREIALPVPPYTSIAFNVFNYVVIECVSCDEAGGIGAGTPNPGNPPPVRQTPPATGPTRVLSVKATKDGDGYKLAVVLDKALADDMSPKSVSATIIELTPEKTEKKKTPAKADSFTQTTTAKDTCVFVLDQAKDFPRGVYQIVVAVGAKDALPASATFELPPPDEKK